MQAIGLSGKQKKKSEMSLANYDRIWITGRKENDPQTRTILKTIEESTLDKGRTIISFKITETEISEKTKEDPEELVKEIITFISLTQSYLLCTIMD